MTSHLKSLILPAISFIICMAFVGPFTYDNPAFWVTGLYMVIGMAHGMWARERWDRAKSS